MQKLVGAAGVPIMIVKVTGGVLKPLEPMLLLAWATTENGPKVPFMPPVMSGNVKVKLPMASAVVITVGEKGVGAVPINWNSSTVALGLVSTDQTRASGCWCNPGVVGDQCSVGVTGA